MDWTHGIILLVGVVQTVGLGVIALAVVRVAANTAQIEETVAKIAEMASRNERMTQSIL